MNKNEEYERWLARRAASEAPSGFADRVMSALPASTSEDARIPVPLQAAIWIAACLVLCIRVFSAFSVFLPS